MEPNLVLTYLIELGLCSSYSVSAVFFLDLRIYIILFLFVYSFFREWHCMTFTFLKFDHEMQMTETLCQLHGNSSWTLTFQETFGHIFHRQFKQSGGNWHVDWVLIQFTYTLTNKRIQLYVFASPGEEINVYFVFRCVRHGMAWN